MANTMTPSAEGKTMTTGQINQIVDRFRATLEKYSQEFGSEPVQMVLGQPKFVDEAFNLFRRFVEAVSNLIVRVVSVNRNRAPQEAIAATGRAQYVNSDVVNAMPHGEGEKTEVVFFRLGRCVSDNDLENEYAFRGLKPVDPYSLATVNETDPAFTEDHPNCTHWRDSNGKWCYAAFDRWNDGKRNVHVNRNDYGWNDSWWFAGVRK